MNFEEYQQHFKEVMSDPHHKPPYDKPAYLEYASLNWSRMNRWFKLGVLTDDLKRALAEIFMPQHWIVITEAWCGDAAHIIPFIEMAGGENGLISVEYQLRDSPPYLIEAHLTNGARAIPKLIIRNDAEQDLGTWGPRPADCQRLYNRLKAENADAETQKTALQKWYNTDKGRQIQDELTSLLNGLKT